MDCVNLLLITSTYLLYFWNKNVLATESGGAQVATTSSGQAAGARVSGGSEATTDSTGSTAAVTGTPAAAGTAGAGTPAAAGGTPGAAGGTPGAAGGTPGAAGGTPGAAGAGGSALAGAGAGGSALAGAGAGLTLELGKGKVATGDFVVTRLAADERLDGYEVYVYEKGSGDTVEFNVDHVQLNGTELKVNNQPVKVSSTTKVTVYWKGNAPVLLCFSKPKITDTIKYTYYQFDDGNQWREANKTSYNTNSDGKLDSTETKKLLDDVCRGLGDKLEKLKQPEEVVAAAGELQGNGGEGDYYSTIGISVLSLLAIVVSA